MNNQIANVYIGYDSKEVVAYHALCQSIIDNTSIPVRICPISLGSLKGTFSRAHHPLQSTEFSFSRFLTPYLSGYEGWSLFMDCDMIFRRDIAELWSLRDDRFSVMCCQHNYSPRDTSKFLGNAQSKYEKKNWSSLILFNNPRCKRLTPEYVNTHSGLELHQFKWLGGDEEIGALPLSWNHLVGEYRYDPDAAVVHFTVGGPYFDAYRNCAYAEEWVHFRKKMVSVKQEAGRELQPA